MKSAEEWAAWFIKRSDQIVRNVELLAQIEDIQRDAIEACAKVANPKTKLESDNPDLEVRLDEYMQGRMDAAEAIRRLGKGD